MSRSISNSYSLTRERSRISRYPRINWGRGRLLPYESPYSLVAKFARLNGIGAKQARDFLGHIAGQTNWVDFGFDDTAAKRLSRLLDEPAAIIKTIGFSALSLPIPYVTTQLTGVSDDLHEVVVCCPTCLAKGYHASFHLYAWLKKCPIHCDDLVQIAISSDWNTPAFDRFVGAVGQMLDRATAGAWLSLGTRAMLSPDLGGRRFKSFRHWLRSVHRYMRSLASSNVVSLAETMPSKSILPELLGRITWAVPMSKSMVDLFRLRPTRIEPSNLDYPADVVGRFASLFKTGNTNASYRLFASFYKSTIAAVDGMPRFRELMLSRIEDMKSEFADVAWQWGYSQNGWKSVDPRGWPYWMVDNPLERAIEDLHSDWTHTDIFADGTRRRSNAMMAYTHIAHDYMKRGVLAIVNDSETKVRRVYRPFEFMVPFTIEADDDVIALIEDMLFFEAVADAETIHTWLSRVAGGAEPVPGPEQLSPGDLMLEPHQAQLRIWPRAAPT